MFLLATLHSLLDTLLSYFGILQTRQLGWHTIDRKTGQLKREQESLWKKIRLLVLFNPLTEWLDKTHWMRSQLHKKNIAAGNKEGAPSSHRDIQSFIDFYKIDMSLFSPSDPKEYGSMKDFFIRKFAVHARPIDEPSNTKKAMTPADARLAVFPSVSETKALWIKGNQFTIGNLLQDDQLARRWRDGAVASLHLSPQDYHRYHSPITGTVKWFRQIPGDYYQVDPVVLHSSVNTLTTNARCCICIENEKFGQVLFAAIGSTDIGTVVINEPMREPGHYVKKGKEIGYFEYGGSAILVVFEKGKIKFDDDLQVPSEKDICVEVEVGQSMGRAGSEKQ